MIRYAKVEGQLREPVNGLKGLCPGCDKPVIAKCGRIKIHHWAHKVTNDCDSWWEPMTEWHLEWQNNFKEEWREVILRDEQSGVFHRADIHTPNGVTIEFQNSSLSLDELESRDIFYKKLIWVVNAQPFQKQIHLIGTTINPESSLLKKFNFTVDLEGVAKVLQFNLKLEYRDPDPRRQVKDYSLDDDELEEAADKYYNSDRQYWLFSWKNKRRAWLNSRSPVFLDFGDDSLYWIKKRLQEPTPLLYLKVIKKEDFLAKYTISEKN